MSADWPLFWGTRSILREPAVIATICRSAAVRAAARVIRSFRWYDGSERLLLPNQTSAESCLAPFSPWNSAWRCGAAG
jgi:hypothetical protein